MFYSQEVLTSRTHGVATIWLVATLGSRSLFRKVNRKAILDVDIPKACDTVLWSSAPMALRLQSNLMYGISKVYAQQCQYVLTDAQMTQANIRSLLRLAEATDLDPNAGSIKPEQLIVHDDPAFIPGGFNPFLDIELSDMTIAWKQYPQATAQSDEFTDSMSAGHGMGEAHPSLEIPSSCSENVGAFDFPSSSVKGSVYSRGLPYFDDYGQLEGFDPNVAFEFDEEGNFQDDKVSKVETVRDQVQQVLYSNSKAGARPRGLDDDRLSQRKRTNQVNQDDSGVKLQTMLPLPDESLFPENVHAYGESLVDLGFEEELTLKTSGYARKQRRRQIILTDRCQQIRNSELASWNANYANNMGTIREQKTGCGSRRRSKLYARQIVFGAGINSVGLIGASLRTAYPLATFAGDELEGLVGERSLKRPIGSIYNESSVQSLRKQQRTLESPANLTENQGGFDQDDTNLLRLHDDEVEVGRMASAALEDHSSQMPWNMTFSRHGSRQSSTLHAEQLHREPTGMFQSDIPIRGIRPLFQTRDTSPIRGCSREKYKIESPSKRFRVDPSYSNDSGSPFNLCLPQSDDESAGATGAGGLGAPVNFTAVVSVDDKGPRPVLSIESSNFLEFVKNGARSAHIDNISEQHQDVTVTIAFSTLLPKGEYTGVVAANAFMHILALSTNSLLRVTQQSDFGPIHIEIEI